MNLQIGIWSGKLLIENTALIKNDAATCYQDLNPTAHHDNLTDIRMSTRFFPLPGSAKKII